MPRLTIAEMRDLEGQLNREEITYSRMVEIINEKINYPLSDEEIENFARDSILRGGVLELNELNKNLIELVCEGAKWARWKLTGIQVFSSNK